MKETRKYWEDENRNKWSKNLYSEQEAFELSKDCVNCEDCKDCEDCEDCKDCKDCVNCKDCEDCKGYVNCVNCKDCKGCEDCKDCKGCEDCMNCEGCKGCKDCEDCKGCKDCVNCEGCKGCKGCKGCEDCVNCKDCKGCVNCVNCKDCKGCVNCVNCWDCWWGNKSKKNSRLPFGKIAGKTMLSHKQHLGDNMKLSEKKQGSLGVNLMKTDDALEKLNSYFDEIPKEDKLIFAGVVVTIAFNVIASLRGKDYAAEFIQLYADDLNREDFPVQ